MKQKRNLLSPIYLLSKFSEKGIVESFRRGYEILLRDPWKYCYYRLFLWPVKLSFYTHLIRLLFLPRKKTKRLLGIWDFKSLPWSIGDPLTFIQTLNCLRIGHDAEETDICIIYDSKFPVGNRFSLERDNINSANAEDFMIEFLPIFHTCEKLGAIFQFNSRSEFLSFIKNYALKRYQITFPSIGNHLGECYNLLGGNNLKEIQQFYKKYQYIPSLRIAKEDINCAYDFYNKNMPVNSIPISVSLKLTMHSKERNADPEIWSQFFRLSAKIFPEIKFIIVGLREEIIPDMKSIGNVLFAKEYGSTLTEDFALIRTSLMYMGTTSGIANIAIHSELPYLIFRFCNYKRIGILYGEQFCFSNPYQRIFPNNINITAEFLLEKFQQLYLKLDNNQWLIKCKNSASIKFSHPSTTVANNS